MAERVICELCGRVVPPHAHYIVRIDVFADPALPAQTAEELEEMDLDDHMRELLEEMKQLSADELQDQVHRRFEYHICRPCQVRFIANPLGLPRLKRPGEN